MRYSLLVLVCIVLLAAPQSRALSRDQCSDGCAGRPSSDPVTTPFSSFAAAELGGRCLTECVVEVSSLKYCRLFSL